MLGSKQAPAAESNVTGLGGKSLAVGDEHYLWALVLLEVGALVLMRQMFKRYHGG